MGDCHASMPPYAESPILRLLDLQINTVRFCSTPEENACSINSSWREDADKRERGEAALTIGGVTESAMYLWTPLQDRMFIKVAPRPEGLQRRASECVHLIMLNQALIQQAPQLLELKIRISISWYRSAFVSLTRLPEMDQMSQCKYFAQVLKILMSSSRLRNATTAYVLLQKPQLWIASTIYYE